MSQPRRHHYCPQFYLGTFTEDGSKDGRLWVFDRTKQQVRKSKPVNEAHQRDFYKMELNNDEDPFALEKDFSKIEGGARAAIDHIHRSRSLPDLDGLGYLLSFAGLLAVRTPGFRRQISNFNEELTKKTIAIAVADKSRFETVKARLNRERKDVLEEVSYEDMQDFIKQDRYTVETHQNHQLIAMLQSASTITDCLLLRNWAILVADDGLEFVCSDNPVGLDWTNPQSGESYRSPGFGVKRTEVTIPLSKKVGLIGIFEPLPYQVSSLDKDGVAGFNNASVMRSQRFIYSSSQNFTWRKVDGEITGIDDYFQIHSVKDES